MLIEEDVLMAEKRGISEVSSSENASQTRANKRAPRVTRSGVVYSVPTAKSQIIQETEVERDEAPSSSHVTLGNAPKPKTVELPVTRRFIVPLKRPIHPSLPMDQPGDKEARIRNEVESIVDRIVNETVIPMSFSDVAALSPVARSKIKQTLTKPQANRRVKEKKLLKDQSQVLIGEISSTLPKGKSVPRTHGTINGTHCELILDGGCTSYIVSLNFIKKLGITEIERTNASVMFGDGKSQEVIGIARNLQLRVGQSSLVDAFHAFTYYCCVINWVTKPILQCISANTYPI